MKLRSWVSVKKRREKRREERGKVGKVETREGNKG